MSFFDRVYEPAVRYGEEYPIFNRVTLETSSWCTRKCRFCPSSKRRERKVMSDSLYYRIIDQLHELDFRGTVQWFLLNEPLLDPDWYRRVRTLREACLKCKIMLTTNGDLLDGADGVLKMFAAGVNSVNLNAYDDRDGRLKRYRTWSLEAAGIDEDIKIKSNMKWSVEGPRAKYLTVSDRRRPRGLHSWGDAKIAALDCVRSKPRSKYCARPHRHVVVMYDGRVPLCCAVDTSRPDFESMGDLNTQKLTEVWNGEEMFRYRYLLENAVREGQCAGCVETSAYPHVVRGVVPLERWKDG